MKYEELLADLEPLDVSPDDIMRAAHVEPCAVCGQNTPFVDINVEVFLCSEECSDVHFERVWHDTFDDSNTTEGKT